MLKLNEVYIRKNLYSGISISRVVGLTDFIALFIEFDVDVDGNIDVEYISEPIYVYKSSRIKGNKKVWYKLARQYAKRNQNR